MEKGNSHHPSTVCIFAREGGVIISDHHFMQFLVE